MRGYKAGDVFYMKGDRRKYHIVHILEGEETPQVVYKYFGIHKRWWLYEIEPLRSFNHAFESGLYYIKER